MIYLDTNIVIRLVEGTEYTRQPLVQRLSSCLGKEGSLITSLLTRLECRSKPLRNGDVATLAQFDIFFSGQELILADVTADVLDLATELRAKYQLKTPDAIQYATAVAHNALIFLTGDRTFVRCSEVTVELL